MDVGAAQSQIEQMIGFILAEAKDKAVDIQKKGEEEFSIEVYRLITEQKEKVRQNYEKKAKQIETKLAIDKSTAINKQRLEKIKARQEMMMKISDDVRAKLVEEMKKTDQSKSFVTKLIVQGLLMLLENDVKLRCRECDVKLVESVLKDASAEYAKVIKNDTGATKSCTLTIDKKTYLPPAPTEGKDMVAPAPTDLFKGSSCLGGVFLLCQDDKITIDNTIDMRVRLVMEQDKPAIRRLLFPQ